MQYLSIVQAEFLRKNPLGVVPVMEVQRKAFPIETISDSLVIVEYLERAGIGGTMLTSSANEDLAWNWARRYLYVTCISIAAFKTVCADSTIPEDSVPQL